MPEHDEIRIVSDSLIATQSKLKKEIALVKNFIAHASHEFRTPLMVISSQAELLSAMGDTNNQQETSINKIQDTTQQINNLLQHLLLLSDTQANKEYRTETIQIHETITHICDNIQHKHQNKHIDLEIIYEKNAPDTLQAYPGSLDIIVRNLLDNAYKYSPAQSLIHLTIS